MSIITGIDGTVLILGTGIAIAICIVAGLAIKKIRATARGNSAEISAGRIPDSPHRSEIPGWHHGRVHPRYGFYLRSASKGY